MVLLLTFLIYCAVAAIGAFMLRRRPVEPATSFGFWLGVLITGVFLALTLVVPELVRALVH